MKANKTKIETLKTKLLNDEKEKEKKIIRLIKEIKLQNKKLNETLEKQKQKLQKEKQNYEQKKQKLLEKQKKEKKETNVNCPVCRKNIQFKEFSTFLEKIKLGKLMLPKKFENEDDNDDDENKEELQKIIKNIQTFQKNILKSRIV